MTPLTLEEQIARDGKRDIRAHCLALIVLKATGCSEEQAFKAGDDCFRYWSALLPAPEAPGWQKIETAPKDGTKILTYASDSGIAVSNYEFEMLDELTPCVTWRDDGASPTHWMPLPPAPSAPSVEREELGERLAKEAARRLNPRDEGTRYAGQAAPSVDSGVSEGPTEEFTLAVAKSICLAQGHNWPPAFDRYSVKYEKEAVLKWWIEVAEHAIDAVQKYDSAKSPALPVADARNEGDKT